jgi:hypothetical protein
MPSGPFLIAKIADIGMVTIYYFMFGLAGAMLLDHILGRFDPEDYKDKTDMALFLEIVAHVFAMGVLAYIIRNIIHMIPFPFEGFGGFAHKRLKEIDGGVVLPFVLLLFQRNLNEKVVYLKERWVPTPRRGRLAV